MRDSGTRNVKGFSLKRAGRTQDFQKSKNRTLLSQVFKMGQYFLKWDTIFAVRVGCDSENLALCFGLCLLKCVSCNIVDMNMAENV